MEESRLNLVQDVIDRMLYLSNDELEIFTDKVNVAIIKHPIQMKIQDGIRIYKLNENLQRKL